MHFRASRASVVNQGPHDSHEFLPVEFQVEGLELEVTFHPCPQGRAAEQAAHELDLIENGFQEELTEGRESGIGQVSTSIQVVASTGISGLQVVVVARTLPRQSTGEGPQSAAIQAVVDHQGLGVESDDPPMAISEGMNPRQPVMCRRDGGQAIRLEDVPGTVERMEP